MASKSIKKIFYVYGSSGEQTNLQLYSLRLAWKVWTVLKQKQAGLEDGPIRERCVITTILLGTSLAQLLGQNVRIPPGQEKVLSPKSLLRGVLKEQRLTGQDLVSRFDDLIDHYDACRHFGSRKHEGILSIVVDGIG